MKMCRLTCLEREWTLLETILCHFARLSHANSRLSRDSRPFSVMETTLDRCRTIFFVFQTTDYQKFTVKLYADNKSNREPCFHVSVTILFLFSYIFLSFFFSHAFCIFNMIN